MIGHVPHKTGHFSRTFAPMVVCAQVAAEPWHIKMFGSGLPLQTGVVVVELVFVAVVLV
jgi:hypothetical protein